MISDSNIKKLKMNGLYRCKPNVKYREKLFENNLYHCCNWTFKVIQNSSGRYYMRDTYWSSGDGVWVELTDENFDEFELIFEWDKVKKIRQNEASHYNNYYILPVDSGGISNPKYFVDINECKSKELIIKEIEDNIIYHEQKIKSLKSDKERIENGELDINYF